MSDTSPLTGLLTVGHEDLLPDLFGEVVIPTAVHQERLRFHPHLPAWLTVKAVREHERVSEYRRMVDEGEAEAIELAREIHANRLLIDDRKGRPSGCPGGRTRDRTAWHCPAGENAGTDSLREKPDQAA